MSNIFRNEKYILNSGYKPLPLDIFKKINKFQAFTLDEINSFTFVKKHEHIFNRMIESCHTQRDMSYSKQDDQQQL